MTTKDKIRAEIKKLQDIFVETAQGMETEDEATVYSMCAVEFGDELLSFLDTLEEPVSDDLEDEMEKFIETFGWGKTKHLAEKELISATARHFSEWGEKNAYKAIMKKADEVRDKRFDTDYEIKFEAAAGFDFGCVNVYHEGKLVGQYVEPKEEKKLPEGVEEAADEYSSDPIIGFIDMTAYRAFKAGAEWQKAKMMEEAYEEEVQEVYQDDDGIHCCVSVGTDYKPGTIVYVITIPKED